MSLAVPEEVTSWPVELPWASQGRLRSVTVSIHSFISTAAYWRKSPISSHKCAWNISEGASSSGNGVDYYAHRKLQNSISNIQYDENHHFHSGDVVSALQLDLRSQSVMYSHGCLRQTNFSYSSFIISLFSFCHSTYYFCSTNHFYILDFSASIVSVIVLFILVLLFVISLSPPT
jgi:hypothetical protein